MKGVIENYGYSNKLKGFFVGGWVDLTWPDPVELKRITFNVGPNQLLSDGFMCLYPRPDIKKLGLGFILFADSLDNSPEFLIDMNIQSEGTEFLLKTYNNNEKIDENTIIENIRYAIKMLPKNNFRSRLIGLLNRPSYEGENTFHKLEFPVEIQIDRSYYCPPSGILLVGWMIDPFRRVSRLKLISGSNGVTIDHRQWLKVPRPDVVAAFASKYDIPNDECGFFVHVADIRDFNTDLHIEAQMIDGAIAYAPVSLSLLSGMNSIKQVLSDILLPSDKLDQIFDLTLGPAISSMNEFRLGSRPDVTCLRFGPKINKPLCSVIVPLYGRVDFLEYQLSAMSGDWELDYELIYVLDDPSLRASVESLASVCYEKFRIPFLIMLNSHNVGFAPANNIALPEARGEYICYLNSDVFPRSPGWLGSMLEIFQTHKEVGAVGATLIYEDGTLQHDGCEFERLPEFANWPFPMHPGKGMRYAAEESVAKVEMLTGACMLLKADVAREMGGFDEGYIVGDFEDADLCLRLGEIGLHCYVSSKAILYHLERQSQAINASSWRHNLTLYNAWRFQKKWGDKIG